MKITILQGAFYPVPPIRGGAVEKMWFELGKAFVRAGHEVVQISRKVDELPADQVIEGVKHIRIDGFDTPKNLVVLKIKDLIYTLRALRKAPEADIIITNTFWAPILFKAKAGRQMVDIQRMPKGQIKFYGKASRLRANSSAVINAILDELPKAKSKCVMIPNPLPFIPEREVNLEAKEKRFLYTGRIHPEKGIHLLLAAFMALENDILKDWKLDLVGPWEVGHGGGGAEYKNNLEAKFRSSAITWHGPIYDTDALNKFYERASFFVYSSLAEKGETFGLAPLEAMAWGTVPIVSKLDCFGDFIKDGTNGFIFNHRLDDPVTALREKIAEVVNMNRDDCAMEAGKVRQSHAVDTIAQEFIIEFENMLR